MIRASLRRVVLRRLGTVAVASKAPASWRSRFRLPLLVLATAAAAASEGVLVIHSNQRATPAAIVIENTLGKVVPEALQRPVELYSEYLDIEWASTETYAAAQAEFLRQKYAARNVGVIVASAPAALGFVIRFRDRMLPGVPVVHVAVAKDSLEQASLPPDVVGKTIDLDPTQTLELALRLQPSAKRLVIVLGAAERDRMWERRLRKAVGQLEAHVEVDYLVWLAHRRCAAPTWRIDQGHDCLHARLFPRRRGPRDDAAPGARTYRTRVRRRRYMVRSIPFSAPASSVATWRLTKSSHGRPVTSLCAC